MKSVITTNLALAALALLAAGCGAESPVADEGSATESTSASELAMDSAGAVYIEDIKLFGSGCPEGSATATLDDDGHPSLSITFDEMILQYFSSSRPKFQRVNCVATLSLHVPDDVKVTPTSGEVSGYALFPGRAKGTLTSSYFLAGRAGRQHRSELKASGTYNVRDDLRSSGINPPCGSFLLGINLGLNLDAARAPNDYALVKVDKEAVRFTESSCP